MQKLHFSLHLLEDKHRNMVTDIFTHGPISPEKIADLIYDTTQNHSIGGHDIFIGQVRADEIDKQKVTAIEFTAYEAMALEKVAQIKEEAFDEFPDLQIIEVMHSLGEIVPGGICFVVFAASGHRDAAFKACRKVAESIKADVPIFGKEILANKTFQWKKNNI